MFIKEQIQSLQRGLTVDESFSSSQPLATLRHQVRPCPQRPVLTPQSVPMSQRLTEGRKRPRVAGQGDCYALRQICGEMGPGRPTAWPSPGRLPLLPVLQGGWEPLPWFHSLPFPTSWRPVPPPLPTQITCQGPASQ